MVTTDLRNLQVNEDILDALKYVRGYCKKHIDCEKSKCRLYNPLTKQCFLCDQVIPADWDFDEEEEL